MSTTPVNFIASEMARFDSIAQRDALTAYEADAVAEAESEARAERAAMDYWENRGRCDFGVPRMAPDGSGCICGCS